MEKCYIKLYNDSLKDVLVEILDLPTSKGRRSRKKPKTT